MGEWCEKSGGKEITFLLAIETIDLLGKNTDFVFQDRSLKLFLETFLRTSGPDICLLRQIKICGWVL